ncbi:MAG TPA: hypothetical protein VNJ47_09095 [Nevskiales bacterium]|nr:hypothetical protein [Nevskiales bacterium]
MLDHRSFWIANIIGLLAIYAGGAYMAFNGQPTHWLALLTAIILVAHLIEIPLAFSKLKARSPQPLRVAVLTFVLGLLWWVPASRGMFAVR